ncbi:uncharacterized protein LOC131643413 [Vicia villosa]|uniref:uncharacterized protein LOC131643413 n=1 Tax=Vicia villosa TaxID=3911 RepID=UPI00273B1896|nr:uncharacterized protein LOC131643413 [Vicia villosa]
MYIEFRGERPSMNWRKLFYQNHARPRARFTLWLTVLERLPTKDRLEKIGIHIDGKCLACDNVETVNHIFFACRFTQHIWSTLINWIGYPIRRHDWDKELEWIIAETTKKDGDGVY